jgi:signal transduction histidine kinase
MDTDGLFDHEEGVIRSAEDLLAVGGMPGDCADRYRQLVGEYRKLFNQTKRVVKISDKIDLELKLSREELKRQNEILLENARLREDVERITRHDLKAPLIGIIGFPQIISEELGEALPPDLRACLASIEESGYTMLNMINLSLDLYKMETGAYVFRPAAVNLVRVVGKILKEAQPLVNSRKVEVRVLVNNEPAGAGEFLVLGEELLCYSMLSNLIRNALEASPKQGDLTVSLDDDPAGGAAAVRIRNQGEVPQDMRGRFFEKYATAGKSGGTGLGTYSARLIAETQKGGIELDSSEPGATTVTVRLPRVPAGSSSGSCACARD